MGLWLLVRLRLSGLLDLDLDLDLDISLTLLMLSGLGDLESCRRRGGEKDLDLDLLGDGDLLRVSLVMVPLLGDDTKDSRLPFGA